MYKKHAALLSTIFLLCLVEFLQVGMVTFASAPIRGEIDASPEEYSFVAAVYACLAVVVIAKQHWLIERLGWRHYVLGSIAVHILGSLICSMSSDLTTFTLGRVVMALGGSAFMSTARVLVQHMPAGPGRFVGVKVFATGLAGGSAAAPLLASIAVSEDTWQAMFWVLISATSLTAVLAFRCLPKDPHPEEEWSRSSPARILLLGLASFFLLYVLQRSYYDFYNDTDILLGFVGLAAFAFYTYFHGEHRHETPLLKVRELWKPRFVLGISLFSFSYIILGANNYILPTFLQAGLGYSWETIGHFQSLGLAGAVVTWLIMLRVLPRYPAPKKFYVLGFLGLGMYGWLLSSVTPEANLWEHVLPALLLNGSFTMLVLATTAMQGFRDVMHEDKLFSHALQVKNMLREIASALGTCVATLLIQWRSTVQYNSLNVRLTQGDPVFSAQQQHLTQYLSLVHEGGVAAKMAMTQLGQQISQQASLLASIEYFWVVIWVASLSLAFMLWQQVFR
ncbi:TPA: MFS transporter [Pseudomonas aeruginosa]